MRKVRGEARDAHAHAHARTHAHAHTLLARQPVVEVLWHQTLHVLLNIKFKFQLVAFVIHVKQIADAQHVGGVEKFNVSLRHLLCRQQLDREEVELLARKRRDQRWKRHMDETVENPQQRLGAAKGERSE